MSATYSANAGNVSLAGGTSITIPQDGDGLSSGSVNVALQREADYIEAIRTGYGQIVLPFSGTVGNSASTTYYLLTSAVSQATAGLAATTATNGTEVWFPFAVKVRAYSWAAQNAMVGGTATLNVSVSGTTTSLAVSQAGAISAAVLGSPISVAAAPTYLALRVDNGTGVSTGFGIVTGYLFLTIN